MLKVSYIITLLSGIGLFNSCTGNFLNVETPQGYHNYVARKESLYGNYLAGRVAHIRQDYDRAAYYYVKSVEKGMVNEDILGKTYIILTSKGNIKEAVKYANIARQKGDNNSFIDLINAVNEFKSGNYRLSRSVLNNINETTYKKLISPLFSAWTYVAEGNYTGAMDSLKSLKDKEVEAIYHLHAGMIAEQFDKNNEAEKHYKKIIDDKANDISFRALQIISNFLVRNYKKDEAMSLIGRYYWASNIKEMLSSLNKKIKQSDSSIKPIVKTAELGVGEVFLEIALLFKSVPAGYEYAQIYMAISEYFNSNNDVTKIAMADLFEERFLLDKANTYYDSIKKDSEMYYPAQMKKANNLTSNEKYDEAIVVLKKLLKSNPKNFQILFNLGDALRISDKQE